MTITKLLFPAIAAAALAVPAGAAPANAGQLLLDVDFAPRDIAQVEIGDFHFRPGQTAPVHTHAAPAIGYVSKGTIYYQVEGMPAQILKAGDAFYEPVGPRILHFDNASGTEEAVFTDFNLEQAGEPFIVFEHTPTEKIDRRTFPTAPIFVPGARRAVAHAQSISPTKPLVQRTDEPIVGYVAAGSVTLSIDGAAPRSIARGRSYYVPAGSTVRFSAHGKAATVIGFDLLR